MKFYYIWDAYCGWSYGFNQLLKDFMADHPQLDLKLISGGLFVDEFAQPIENFSHIPSANQQISHLYGTSFGQPYEKVLAAGRLVLDSTYPATAFALMREKVAKHAQLELALAIQSAFYQEGKSLSSLDTYLELSRRFGLNRLLLRQDLETAFASQALATADFEVAEMMGVTSFPTLILEVGDQYAVLDTAVATVQEFEEGFKKQVERLQKGD